jgi:hypothetical protein
LYEYSKAYPNSEQEEFWNLIVEDLEFAIKYLPYKSEYALSDEGRVTKGAANALLGKSYLYKASHHPEKDVNEDFRNAKKYLKEVVKSGEYELMMPKGNDSLDYVLAFACNFSSRDLEGYKAENNSECIYAIQNSDQTENIVNEWNPGFQSDGSNFTAYFGINGFRNVVPTASMFKAYKKTPNGHPCTFDPRRTASIYKPGDTISHDPNSSYYKIPFEANTHSNSGISQGYGLRKYIYPVHEHSSYGAFLDPTDWRILRYADVLLMLSEAEYHLNGSSAEALDALNQVRERVGMAPVANVTPEAIMHERDVELFAECVRFPDLVRWLMLPEPWVEAKDIHPNFNPDQHEYLPIPQIEIINMRGALKQNPGW